jgi:hypothetical protein
MLPSFGKNKPRGKLRRQIASSALSNLVSGSSAVGSAALSAVSSVLPSLTFEPEFKPVSVYNAEREERKRESRKKSYTKLATLEREKLKQRHEAEVNNKFKKMAQKLMNQKKQKRSKAKLPPIQKPSSTLRRNVNPLVENNSNHSNTISSLSELYYNQHEPIILGNITHLVNNKLSGKYPSGWIPNPMRNFEQPRRTPNLENNYRPPTTTLPRKRVNIANAQRRNRELYPNTYENNA